MDYTSYNRPHSGIASHMKVPIHGTLSAGTSTAILTELCVYIPIPMDLEPYPLL